MIRQTLVQSTNRKSYTTFDWCHLWWHWRTFEGHFSNLWQDFASRGLWAIAELIDLLLCAQTNKADWRSRGLPWGPIWRLHSVLFYRAGNWLRYFYNYRQHCHAIAYNIMQWHGVEVEWAHEVWKTVVPIEVQKKSPGGNLRKPQRLICKPIAKSAAESGSFYH